MEEFLKLMEAVYPVHPELQVHLLHNIKREVYHANKVILREGQRLDGIVFVERGLVKKYTMPDNGSERINQFCKTGQVIVGAAREYTGQPSMEIIRAVDEVWMRRIPNNELDTLLKKFPSFNFNIRFLSDEQNHLLLTYINLLGLAKGERLNKLQEITHWILYDPRIKDCDIASYLCVDKATLSRSRKGR
ncbi:MAG: cyclic nucleotide-binding protein [Chitinophagaceae bacterium]|nr:cyclic nucleotide-binding protein [Chitinophagaceae bacterium]